MGGRARTESIVHFFAAALELDPEATIVSVDGIGAFDTMELGVPGANECLPFVRMFYSEPSEYVCNDSGGVPHIVQSSSIIINDRIIPTRGSYQGQPANLNAHATPEYCSDRFGMFAARQDPTRAKDLAASGGEAQNKSSNQAHWRSGTVRMACNEEPCLARS